MVSVAREYLKRHGDDHPRLFRSLHDALNPGGRVVAQCGGRGEPVAHPSPHRRADARCGVRALFREVVGPVGVCRRRDHRTTARRCRVRGHPHIHRTIVCRVSGRGDFSSVHHQRDLPSPSGLSARYGNEGRVHRPADAAGRERRSAIRVGLLAAQPQCASIASSRSRAN
jgi:hypothetical protein